MTFVKSLDPEKTEKKEFINAALNESDEFFRMVPKQGFGESGRAELKRLLASILNQASY